ncbi:MAG: allophanate hydrolase [Phreatobacter sp.]|uniref:allophanate hydrolase n=1 Tax=Phreatobacter sp. TaxID=1966341 RepID=UPI00273702D6|nr:allophanate hydrolase [Phreatobacter sp.]MDP2803359.1 allophanate hydrolase [Phreatobacter sp.]
MHSERAPTITDLHAGHASGTPVAATVAAVYRRIAAVDDPGIFIHLRPEADVQARAAALPPFDPVAFPLWGVPVAVKDNIDVAGLPTTAACPAFSFLPDRSATVVEKLVAAGALVIGKTNLDQFATGLVGVRSPYPIPRNAFDPARVPGGSSSGSAIAVARGIVPIALGTDTAGSGRVPAGLNDLVGLKPSLGALSTRGVLPACRTLDCVSVFAHSVEDAFAAYAVMRGLDPEDAYSRPVPNDLPSGAAVITRLGVPRNADRLFFGDGAMAEAFMAALSLVTPLADSTAEIDFTAFFDVAKLLYEGPWVAERHAAMRAFLATNAADVHPVTRLIVGAAERFSATDAFEGLYRLASLRRATENVWERVDALVVPTAPVFPTLADLAADPIGPNSRLGTYTNFVNLLDLAALSVPGPFRPDGLPAGITLIGPRGSDAALARLGAAFVAAAGERRHAASPAAA